MVTIMLVQMPRFEICYSLYSVLNEMVATPCLCGHCIPDKCSIHQLVRPRLLLLVGHETLAHTMSANPKCPAPETLPTQGQQ